MATHFTGFGFGVWGTRFRSLGLWEMLACLVLQERGRVGLLGATGCCKRDCLKKL